MPCIRRRIGQNIIKILIDTGANSNYCRPNIFKDPIDLPIFKKARTPNGDIIIKTYHEVLILNKKTRFYVLDNLEFDALIGTNLLKLSKAKIDIEKQSISYDDKTEKFFMNDEELIINNIISTGNMEELRNVTMKKIQSTHANVDISLPFRTDIKAEIRTINEKPIWSKQYPYPFSVNDFVNKEIQRMLHEDIIRPSKSPYNSPIWIVPKKGTNEDGSAKHRLVIDYKKLNENTTSDKYPIPETNIILSNLGKAKFFSTLDLESGFHQILMNPKDIEKTAFSVNNGKYEYVRMPFGLKNAPSIFQRAMDNILRPYVGKICHIYIDDIIIYSETLEQHIRDIDTIMYELERAHMKISIEKSRLFEKEVEFLGYVISHNVIKTNPEKVKTINDFPLPQTLRQLRSFLGMIGYYRKFIENYALIAKPLTKYLQCDTGQVSTHMAKKTIVNLDNDAIEAFNKLKKHLVDQIELNQPNYNKKFVLTTDASDDAIGAVLAQDNRPITFISKTLNKTERNYATNEKELLAIVFALKNLRNYLYGITNLEIHTDHQPLTFAVSPRNPNSKMKRWHAFIEEYSPKFVYKPGKENVVADALSRQNLNHITDDCSVHSAEESEETIYETFDRPVNSFKQQIIINKNIIESILHEQLEPFPNFKRHLIEYNDPNDITNLIKTYIKPGNVGIYCTAEVMYNLKDIFKHFTNKFIFCTKFASDITNDNDQEEIIAQTHTRAHRNYKENIKQIENIYYWPTMRQDFEKFVRYCDICQQNKYERNPHKEKIAETPIPKQEGETIHIDILRIQNIYSISAIDKYSKYLVLKIIDSKLDMEIKFLEILQTFPNCKNIICDNDTAFTSYKFKNMLTRQGITPYYVPIQHSKSNGQVERAHSTIQELARCIKKEYHLLDDEELLLKSTLEYNKTIHSSTDNRPIDILYNKVKHDDIRAKLLIAQENMLKHNNKSKSNKPLIKNAVVYIKRTNERQGKLQPKYRKEKVKEDLGNKIKIQRKDKIIHKDNVKFSSQQVTR